MVDKVCLECEAALPYAQRNVVVAVSVDGNTQQRIFAVCESHGALNGTPAVLTTEDLERYRTWLPPE